MKEKLYSIGQVSKIKNISIKTLRFYDEIGVLKPYYVDPFTKYRYYSIEQLIYIDIIKELKILKLGTKEMKKIISENNKGLESFLINQEKVIEREITELENIKRRIGYFKKNIVDGKSAIQNDSLYYKEYNERYLLLSEGGFNGILNKYTNNDIEIMDEFILLVNKYINEINNYIENNYLESMHTYGISMVNEGEKFIPDKYFIEININENSKYNINRVKKLEKGNFICINYNNNNYKEKAEIFNKYIDDNNIKLREVYQFELYEDVFKETNNYEIQGLL